MNRALNILLYSYIGLPVVIFLIGWVRWWISVPVCLIVLWSFFTACRNNDPAYLRPAKSDRRVIISASLIICAWVYLSGVGGLVYQNDDHLWRNTLFSSLVSNPWPVLKDISVAGGMQTRLVNYYLGFWMPSAVIGKIFGLDAGYYFQVVWAVLGIILVYLKISEHLGHYSIYPLLIFILFSGLDIAGYALIGEDVFSIEMSAHLEWWTDYQFSSHTSMLFFVFNQAIYGWLLTMMILSSKSNRHSILVWSCGLLECTFPFVGLLPFLCWKVIVNYREKAKAASGKAALRDLFSLENILGGGAVGLISFLFLYGNDSAGQIFLELPTTRDLLFIYLLFVFVEVGVYYIAVLKGNEKNPLYYLSLFMLLICPFFRVGTGSQDFCMRASIPALLVLCLLVTKSLYAARKTNRLRFGVLLAVFLIGCFTPVHEYFRATRCTPHFTGLYIYLDENEFYTAENYTCNAEDNLFVRYLAK